MNNIKVFFNDNHLLITKSFPADAGAYKTRIEEEGDVFDFRMQPDDLFKEAHEGNILVVTPLVEETLESIFEYAKTIIAGGGIVKNEEGKTLIIFRRGYWDLAKGKVEKGEKIIAAAQREVEEETGIQIESLQEDAIITYHCYRLKGKECIKETHWYHMQARPGQSKLVPQTEEDIEQVLWATDSEIKVLQDKFHPLIWTLLVEQLHL